MSLEKLRSKAIYQNTIDTWISICLENNIDWYNVNDYKKFISYLINSKLNLKKFPLCIKESGGIYERGKDKTKFAEELSNLNDINTMAYTIKLNDFNIQVIRKFKT